MAAVATFFGCSAAWGVLLLAQVEVAAGDCVPPFCEYLPCDKVVGSCRVLSCDAEHGTTTCVYGACLCGNGTCAGPDGYTCNTKAERCQKAVGVTCSVASVGRRRRTESGHGGPRGDCNQEEHGPTRCINGQCLCAEGTCADEDGFCRPTEEDCVKHVGKCAMGSTFASVFGCGMEHLAADCVNGACECKQGFCSEDGVTCTQPNGLGPKAAELAAGTAADGASWVVAAVGMGAVALALLASAARSRMPSRLAGAAASSEEPLLLAQ